MSLQPVDARSVTSAVSPIASAVASLGAARDAWRVRHDEGRDVESFPSRPIVAQVVETLAAALYPRRLGRFQGRSEAEDQFVAAKLIAALADLEREVTAELGYWQKEASEPFEAGQADTIVRLFATTLGDIRALVDSDIEAAFLSDPAARCVDEVLVCYPAPSPACIIASRTSCIISAPRSSPG